MRKQAPKVEIFIDSLIPLALFLVIALTAIELSFSWVAEKYWLLVDGIEVFSIAIFVVNLYFKFRHARSIPTFLKHYWIYILALFPFFLLFRLVERLAKIQVVAEESPLWIKEFAVILRESRLVRFAGAFRFLNIFGRTLRAVYFYENPKIRHKINVKKLLELKKKR